MYFLRRKGDYHLKSHLAGILPVTFGNKGWGEQRPGKPLLKTSWTGILCNSLEHVPIVGRLPQEALGPRRVGEIETGAEWISAEYASEEQDSCPYLGSYPG